MATPTLIVAHRVSASEQEQRFIIEGVTGGAERMHEELDGPALLGLEVRGARSDFDVGSLREVGSERVPRDERGFSDDGLETLGSDPPAASDFRACFFRPCIDHSRAITSPD